MTAGAIIVPAIVPLRPPIPGKSKLSIDSNTKIELSTGKSGLLVLHNFCFWLLKLDIKF